MLESAKSTYKERIQGTHVWVVRLGEEISVVSRMDVVNVVPS
jgi:hypothetical protein